MVSFPNVAIDPSSSSITPMFTGVLQSVVFVDDEDDEIEDELVEVAELLVVLVVEVVVLVVLVVLVVEVVVDLEVVVAR